tara:strand:+ start:472 stop:1782 length:1311 start_codon:yes stop_codon:yes gene_type:complete
MSFVSNESSKHLNKMIPDVYRLGSVKKIRGVEGCTPWLFDFSDHYSLFDWGKMPDELPLKGKSLALMSLAIYDYLEDSNSWESLDDFPGHIDSKSITHSCLEWLKKNGLKTHLKGAWNEKGPINLKNNKEWERLETKGPLYLDFTPFKVQKPKWSDDLSFWDYSCFKKPQLKGFVPLEVVFRFGLPEGSSFRKRIKDRPYLEEVLQTLPESYSNKFMEDLCNGQYDNGLWDFPIIEFSTKWEPEDRFVTYGEAQEISGLSDGEWAAFIEWNRLVAIKLRSFFKKIDLVLWDGKCEWGATNEEGPFPGQRNFVLADSLGPDELRLTYKGKSLSKEILRTSYRKTKWAKYVSLAKEESRSKGLKDWKDYFYKSNFPVNSEPPSLEKEHKNVFSMIYQTLSNHVCKQVYQKVPFPEAMALDDLVRAISSLESNKSEGDE